MPEDDSLENDVERLARNSELNQPSTEPPEPVVPMISLPPKLPEQKPDTSDSHYEEGLNYYNSGDYYLAAEEFKRAVALNPKHFRAYEYLGDILVRDEQYEKAEEMYRKAFHPLKHYLSFKRSHAITMADLLRVRGARINIVENTESPKYQRIWGGKLRETERKLRNNIR